MLKRRVELSPPERRARRIRLISLSLFAAFLAAILLVIAYLGLSFSKRQPQTRIELSVSPAAELTFNLRGAMESARKAKLISGEEYDLLQQEFSFLKPALAPAAQVWFYRGDGPEEEWLAWIPLVRTNRIYLMRIEKMLRESELFAPLGSAETADGEESFAWFETRKEGLLLSSRPEVPGFSLRQEKGGPEGEAVLKCPEGYVPKRYLEQLPRPVRPRIEQADGCRLVWRDDAEEETLLIEFPETGETGELSYFDPIFLTGEEEPNGG